MDWFRRQRVRNAVVQNFSDFDVEGDLFGALHALALTTAAPE